MKEIDQMKNEPDIKAPDGYLLGGFRKVRRDGTILFHRMWWKCPDDWIGKYVQVHVNDGMTLNDIEAAPPGKRIYKSIQLLESITLYPVDRPDAKPAFRKYTMRARH